ncbi:MAG: hypothetical protein H8E39_08560 [Alphaproteobacteria bacterium]|nr:hypothetical protein [Alphaproteobacteria bacterium]
MARSLRARAEEATREIQGILGVSADTQPKEIADALERTITKALLEERHRCADVASKFVDDRDKGNLLSEEINRVNTALIANLSALR